MEPQPYFNFSINRVLLRSQLSSQIRESSGQTVYRNTFIALRLHRKFRRSTLFIEIHLFAL